MEENRRNHSEIPEPTHPLLAVVDQLTRYANADVLAKVGGLQLMPENAGRAERMELAACAAVAAPVTGSTRSIGLDTLRAILGGPQLSHSQLVMREDPVGGWFVESLAFHGGTYLVLPGITTDATFSMRCLVRAIGLRGEPYSHQGFKNSAERLVRAALNLSDAMLHRAGLKRGSAAIDHSEDAHIIVPNSRRLTELSQSVRFSAAEISRLLAKCGTAIADLAPLTVDAGAIDVRNCSPDANPIQATPIVRIGDEFIVVAPLVVLAALRHQILCSARMHMVLPEILLAANQVAWKSATRALGCMDIRLRGGPFPGGCPSFVASDGLFSFDSDKALYACMISDDLVDFDETMVFGAAPRQDLWPELKSHIHTALRSGFITC